jgi:hypothetical protein
MYKKQIAVLCLLSLGFQSCKKSHTCECKDGTGFSQQFSYETTLKRNADAKCQDFEKGFSGGCVLLN